MAKRRRGGSEREMTKRRKEGRKEGRRRGGMGNGSVEWMIVEVKEGGNGGTKWLEVGE